MLTRAKGRSGRSVSPADPSFPQPLSHRIPVRVHTARDEGEGLPEALPSLHDNHRRDLVRSLDASRRASNWGNGWLTLPPALISVSALTLSGELTCEKPPTGGFFAVWMDSGTSPLSGPRKSILGHPGAFFGYIWRGGRGEAGPEEESIADALVVVGLALPPGAPGRARKFTCRRSTT